MNTRSFWISLFLTFVLGVLIFLYVNKTEDENFSPSSSLIPSIIVSYTPLPVSFDTIFQEDHGWTATLSGDKKRVLTVTGDIIPARSVNSQTLKYGDFTWAWKYIDPVLSNGDLTVINLESPLVSNCPVTVSGMVFCGDKRHIEGLLLAGVDVANLANNHAGNYGEEGIFETKHLLEGNGIAVFGLGEPVVVSVKGTKFVFVGFDDIGPTVAPVTRADIDEIKQEIAIAREIGDIIIVCMHWGVEYTDQPSERQKELAHISIDSGADLVIGNHPHWIQPVELYKGAMIMYAHGNTIFDQMWSEETKKGVIGRYTFYDKILVDVEFVPTYIQDYGQPVILEDKAKEQIIGRLKTISQTN